MNQVVMPAPSSFIVYPDSDGQPMAENTVQLRWIVTLYDNLTDQFRQRPDGVRFSPGCEGSVRSECSIGSSGLDRVAQTKEVEDVAMGRRIAATGLSPAWGALLAVRAGLWLTAG